MHYLFPVLCVCMCMLVRSFRTMNLFLVSFIRLYIEKGRERASKKVEKLRVRILFPGLLIMRPFTKSELFDPSTVILCLHTFVGVWVCVCVWGLSIYYFKGVCFCMLFVLEM